jgi:pimeloyl-ACP methyl ester carboxylesterase
VTDVLIDRAFLRAPAGLVHYRYVTGPGEGGAPPLVMAHGGPGSSRDLVPLMTALGVDRAVVAPDMMGNGDSDPPPPDPSIAYYAACLIAVMDHLGLERADLYGTHTGAQVVCEAAIAHPRRVRRLILDGVALFSDAQRAEFQALYAPAITPDAEGAHLQWLWNFTGQMTQRFPYYSRDPAHRIPGGAPPPLGAWTTWAADVLKAWSTYHLAYQAAFSHDIAARLPLVTAPTVILAVAGDPLADFAEPAARLVPDGRVENATRETRPDVLRRLLGD